MGSRIGLFLLIAAAPAALGFVVLLLNNEANPAIVFSRIYVNSLSNKAGCQ